MPPTPLLFLCPRVPWPLYTGAKIRTQALLGALQRHFIIDYMGFLQPDLSEPEARKVLEGCRSVTLEPEPVTSAPSKAWLVLRTLAGPQPVTIAKYQRASLAGRARNWMLANPRGIVHADHLHMAPYLQAGPPTVRRAIDEHNVEWRILARMDEMVHNRLMQPYLRLQTARLRRFEAATVRQADLVLAVSENDAAELAAMAPQTRIEVIPNGVNLDYFTPPPADHAPRPGRLVFSGSMDWLPNQDAMIYFVREVLPLLRERFRRPEPWSLDIVGLAPPPAIQALATGGARVSGTVPDVRPYLREAAVYVVPLRIGGGSRLKILEAFAMGVPVVSTSVGCEGLGVEHEKQLLVAETPEAFAQAVARLAGDGRLRETLTRQAWLHVQEYHGWEAIGRKLTGLYKHLNDPL